MEPGLRVSLSPRLLDEYRHQFEPFVLCGCNMRDHYQGTLFRFPLRDGQAASESEICNVPLSIEDVQEMFESLRQVASEMMLFLHSVTTVEACVLPASGNETELLFRVQISSESKRQASCWSQVARLSQPYEALALHGREAFYQRLADENTEVPKALYTIQVSVCETGGAERHDTFLIVEQYVALPLPRFDVYALPSY